MSSSASRASTPPGATTSRDFSAQAAEFLLDRREISGVAVDTLSIIPGAKLYSPARGSNVVSPPLLAWRPFAGATYYNVQLYYGVGNAFRSLWAVWALRLGLA